MKKETILKILLTISIILLLVVSTIVFINKKDNNNSNNDNNAKYEELTNDRVRDLIISSYYYYLLTYGKIPLKEGTYVSKNIEYHEMKLPFNSFEDIDNLISDTFIKSKQQIATNLYEEKTTRKYLSVGDTLYVSIDKEDTSCDKVVEYDKDFELTKISPNKYTLSYIYNDTNKVELDIQYEDGSWKLNNIMFSC